MEDLGTYQTREAQPSIPKFNSANGQNLAFDRDGHDAKTRVKSSLRMKYEAEAEVIRRKLGDLEAIRNTLGVSQRKVCQLLMVDPSAWTRWTRDGEKAPPHIYRSLQWYLALEEKYPALDVGFWLQTVANRTESELSSEKHAKSDALLRETNLNIEKAKFQSGALQIKVDEMALEISMLRSLLQQDQKQIRAQAKLWRGLTVALGAALIASAIGFWFYR